MMTTVIIDLNTIPGYISSTFMTLRRQSRSITTITGTCVHIIGTPNQNSGEGQIKSS